MKYSKGRIIFISCVVVLLIIALVASGTYAYFTLVVNVNNNGNIGGNTYKFDVSMDVNVIKQSTSLVPFSDALIVDAISKTDKCVDKDGYEICNIYKLNLTNNGNSDEILYGYVSTSNTTYVSDRLKYQVFTLNNGNYAAYADPISVSLNTDEKVYFKKNNTLVNSSLVKGNSAEYYLVMWISLVLEDQNEDAGKSFNGYINFESFYGDRITAKFSS